MLLRFTLRQASSLAHRYFTLDETTGVLRTAQVIDREELCPYGPKCDLNIDVAVRPLQYFEIIKVLVRVKDVNDNSPTFFEDRVTVEVDENTPVGSLFIIPVAEDLDSGVYGVQQYQLISDFDQFELKMTDQVDGSKDVRLKLVQPVDREARDQYTATVLAIDGGWPRMTGTVLIDILIIDSNDNSPRWENSSYETQIYEDTPVLFISHCTLVACYVI